MELARDIKRFFNKLAEGVLLLNEQREIIYRNRAAEKILGARIDLRRRISMENILQRRNENFYRLIFPQTLSCEDSSRHEVAYNRHDGTLILQVTTCTVAAGDRNDGFRQLVVIHDITDLWTLHDREKRLLSQLRKNYIDQMENLRQIAQSVAHEIRNPLVSIGGYTNLLLKKHELLKDRIEYKKYLTYIKKDTERLQGIVRQVERYSDLSEIRFRKENMVLVVRRALKFAVRFAVARGVGIAIHEPDDKEYTIFIDRDKMKIALRNLLKNSILFSERTLPVTASCEFTPFEMNLSIRLHTNLLREDVPFLFNPFYSVKQHRINFELATAQRIALLHGGIIHTLWDKDNLLTLMLKIPKEKRLARG